jgi:prevent-host-death family protein
MRTVKIQEAKTHLSALVARVETGDEVVIARGSHPVARLVPLAASGRRELGFVHITVPDSFFEPLPEDELSAWGG